MGGASWLVFVAGIAVGVAAGQELFEPFEVPSEPERGETAEGSLDALTVVAEAAAPDGLGAISPHAVLWVPEETLRRNAAATLGETLGWEPGVSSSSFGPGASRPVIRGFEGRRVRMLRDGLDTFDLSDISPDHGVALEPFLLESVEVHRGPASLLFGSTAIGGAVDARTRTLARQPLEDPLSGGIESRFETNGEAWTHAGYLHAGAGPFVLTATGSFRESNDIDIPGRARSAEYDRLEQPAYFDPVTFSAVPVPNPQGTLPNSFHEGSSASAGISYLPDHLPLYVGASYARFDSFYGVPYFFDGDAADPFGDDAVDFAQDRFDLEARWEPDRDYLTRLDLRAGYGAYRHAEVFTGRLRFEGRDFVDTFLEKDAYELRADAHHRAWGGRLTGTVGTSYLHDHFTAWRTLVPPPDAVRFRTTLENESVGAYVLEKLELGEFTGQLGYRVESVDVLDDTLEADGFPSQGENGVAQSLSTSLGWRRQNVGVLDELGITGIVSHAERLPSAIERYALWENAGLGRLLVGGDLDGTPLAREQSLGLELGVEAAWGPLDGRVNVYRYQFDNFIFLQDDPALTGGFGRGAQFVEKEAEFTGFEAELAWQIEDRLRLTVMSDFVRAQNETNGQPLPRMPPLRIGARIEWENDSVVAGLEVRHAFEQDRTEERPVRELEADAFTLLNADVSWTLPVQGQEVTLFLRGTNLLDQEARLATSFRKDTAPLPGRSLIVGVRHDF